MSLSGRIVLITGAGGGLGPAVAREMSARGAHLAIADRDERKALELAAELADARGFGADLTAETGAAELVDRVLRHVGEVDALLHLVGGYSPGAVADTDVATWDRMFALNLRSSFLTIRAVLPGMLARRRGTIVGIVARAALESAPGAAAYSASKAALLKLLEVLAAEVRDAGVRVNGVAPSVIDTAANRAALPGADHAGWVSPKQIARALVFLLENEAVTGDVLKIYGRA